MAITAPVHADVLPIGPSIDDPDNFDEEADDFAAAQRPFGIQLNALSDNVYANALAVQTLAGAADGSAQAAATSAGQASSSKSAAVQAAQDAGGYAQAAADFAAAAAVSSTSLIANSSSAVVLGNGTKVFAVPAGKQFPPGELLQIGSTGTPAARMFGTVASYIGTALTVTTTKTQGPGGTYSDWVITPGGADGAPGGTAGGQLTSALDEAKGVSPASSATPDIWNAGGNYVPITQVADITGFPNAPQPAAKRTMFCVNGFKLVNGANLAVAGGTRMIAPGDQVVVTADTVTSFKAYIIRGNGMPVSSQVFTRAEMYLASASIPIRSSAPHRVLLQGTGGSGARTYNTTGGVPNRTATATGGGAGGLAIKDFDGVAASTLVYTAGTPGAAPATNGDGNAGTASTLTGNGISLTANSGNGGKFSQTTPVALPGGDGGSATGGDVNLTGGRGGNAIANVNTTGGYVSAQATGGGGIALKGQGYNGGDITTVSPNQNNRLATGGAGIGGKGGDAAAAGGATQIASGGGGSKTGAPAATADGTGAGGAGDQLVTTSPLNWNGAGGTSPGPGAGSNGIIGSLSSAPLPAGPGGGSGGAAVSGQAWVGDAGLGAGSGGAANTETSPIPQTGLPGGSFVLLLY
jgi:hypothetical protein